MAPDRPSDEELLQRIDGIGPKTSERLIEKFEDEPGNTVGNITRASGSDLSEVKGISESRATGFFHEMRAQDIDKGLYDDDPRERQSRTFGEFSDAVETNMPTTSESPDAMDSMAEVDTTFSRKETNRAEKFHSVRSERAKTIDEQQQAPIADSLDEWINNKNEFDFPGVDTKPGLDF